jgi:hypothetical protein
VSGIYVGYRDVEDETLPFTSVGYATPVDAFAEWRPEILLGRTVREEAETSSFAIPE